MVCVVGVCEEKGRIHGSRRACMKRGGDGAHLGRCSVGLMYARIDCEGTTGSELF